MNQDIKWTIETGIHAAVVLGGTFLTFAIPAVLLVAAIIKLLF